MKWPDSEPARSAADGTADLRPPGTPPARKTIIVFFDMVGVFEEFTLVNQLYFDVADIAPESSYAQDGVRALNSLILSWQRDGHDVFLVCVSGVRSEFTREELTAYLLARGFDGDAIRLHERHSVPKLEDGTVPATKGDEVERWLSQHRWDACVILDDYNDGYRKPSFIHVDPEIGVSVENVEKAACCVARQFAGVPAGQSGQ